MYRINGYFYVTIYDNRANKKNDKIILGFDELDHLHKDRCAMEDLKVSFDEHEDQMLQNADPVSIPQPNIQLTIPQPSAQPNIQSTIPHPSVQPITPTPKPQSRFATPVPCHLIKRIAYGTV